MTSGQKGSAFDGIELIAQLQRQFGDHIEILPAAGVSSENVEHLLQQTGCHQLHGSFRTFCRDRAEPVATDQFGVTDCAAVAAARQRM